MLKITELKWGQFIATNGYDTLAAKYEGRGNKGPDGKFHPSWTLSMYGEDYRVEGGKEDAVQKATDILLGTIDIPLTEEQCRSLQNRDRCVHAITSIEVTDLIQNDIDGLKDLLNDRIAEPVLSDIGMRVIHAENNGTTLIVRVTGNIE